MKPWVRKKGAHGPELKGRLGFKEKDSWARKKRLIGQENMDLWAKKKATHGTRRWGLTNGPERKDCMVKEDGVSWA